MPHSVAPLLPAMRGGKWPILTAHACSKQPLRLSTPYETLQGGCVTCLLHPSACTIPRCHAPSQAARASAHPGTADADLGFLGCLKHGFRVSIFVIPSQPCDPCMRARAGFYVSYIDSSLQPNISAAVRAMAARHPGARCTQIFFFRKMQEGFSCMV